MPTAIVIFIGKAYFDSFLREAGKDHYIILKKAVSGLSSKFFSQREKLGRVGTPDEIDITGVKLFVDGGAAQT